MTADTIPATHFPSGRIIRLCGENGGPSRHQCGGCGEPIVSSYERWLDANTGSAVCIRRPPPDFTPRCVRHGEVEPGHYCRAPGESAEAFTARALGGIRDV